MLLKILTYRIPNFFKNHWRYLVKALLAGLYINYILKVIDGKVFDFEFYEAVLLFLAVYLLLELFKK